MGFTATIFCGLAAIEGKDIPMALLAVAVGGSNLLGGWLNQPNGRDTDNAG